MYIYDIRIRKGACVSQIYGIGFTVATHLVSSNKLWLERQERVTRAARSSYSLELFVACRVGDTMFSIKHLGWGASRPDVMDLRTAA